MIIAGVTDTELRGITSPNNARFVDAGDSIERAPLTRGPRVRPSPRHLRRAVFFNVFYDSFGWANGGRDK